MEDLSEESRKDKSRDAVVKEVKLWSVITVNRITIYIQSP